MNRNTTSGSLPSDVLPMLWRRFSVRHALQSPLQSVLLVVILSLGLQVPGISRNKVLRFWSTPIPGRVFWVAVRSFISRVMRGRIGVNRGAE